MQGSAKVVERKKDFRNISDSQEIKSAQSKASSVTEIDLSFN